MFENISDKKKLFGYAKSLSDKFFWT